MSRRKRWSELPSSSAGRDTVAGRLNLPALISTAGAAARRALTRLRPALEIDIARVLQELTFDRDVKAIVHGVVKLPEADDAGEFDDLRRRQVLLQPLQNLVGNGR